MVIPEAPENLIGDSLRLRQIGCTTQQLRDRTDFPAPQQSQKQNARFKTPTKVSSTLEDRKAVCLATELSQAGGSLRATRRELSRNALSRLLHNCAEAYRRWLVGQCCARGLLARCGSMVRIWVIVSTAACFHPSARLHSSVCPWARLRLEQVYSGLDEVM